MGHPSDVVEELVTVRDYLRWAVSRFGQEGLWYGHGTDNAWDEALALLMQALHLPPEGDARLLDARLTRRERSIVAELIERRAVDRVPVPYLTGRAWFAGLEFAVDERVLIPRSPLAELIQQEMAPWLSSAPDTVLDLCTGSGCIGIACAYAFPEARVTLSDISEDALEVARQNLERHQMADRVTAVQADLFDGLGEQCFDLIISNPPYVDAADLSSMPPEYRHEPALALASGDDGLDFTRRLLRQAADHLTEGGSLVVEVGNSWQALEDAFPQVPFTWIEFESGGGGVFMVDRATLVEHRPSFVE